MMPPMALLAGFEMRHGRIGSFDPAPGADCSVVNKA